ncbi:MAG: hypothetical protein ABI658_11620 [Acidimicrobiales bacterium]
MAWRTARRPALKHTIATTVLLGTFVTLQSLFATGASAALTDVAIDPTSGAAGTAVTVSGSACPPGLLINPSHAGVLIATLGVSIDVVVPASGIWSAQFVVPAGALQGLHAIVVTCTRDLVPLPYVPLTFTVTTAALPPPSTTLQPAGVTTTVASTAPTTTSGADTTTSTTTIATNGVTPGAPPPIDGTVAESSALESATTTPRTTRSTTETISPSTSQAVAAAASGEAVSVARIARPDPRRPLVFGALSPIGRGWMGWLITVLLLALIISGVVAYSWFRWLRHTRAREWWIRWFHQILRIRAHARPPT